MTDVSTRPASRHAFVTGGTGFVGLNLIRALIDQGWTVTAVHRVSSDTRYLDELDITRVPGDITDAASIQAAMPDNVDAVFHVAGDTNLWSANNDRQTRINVEGTRNMLAAARARGARRFIHTSTISAIGRHDRPVSESTTSNAPQSVINYERSKYAAEQLVRQAGQEGLDTVILQPGAIMGPFDTATWAQVFYLLRDGKLAALPPGAVPLNHVREIVTAHIKAAETASPGSEYVLGGHNVKLADLFRRMAGVAGYKAPRMVAPRVVLAGFAAVLATVARVTGKEPDITPEGAAFMSHDNRADSAKAERDLGFAATDIDRCVQDSYDWLTSRGLL